MNPLLIDSIEIKELYLLKPPTYPCFIASLFLPSGEYRKDEYV